MDFPHLGSHCGIKDCNQLDFLPFECDKCFVKYCLDHKDYAQHKCKNFDRINDKKVHPCPICQHLIPIPSNSLLDECVARHLDFECTNKKVQSSVPKSFKCTIKSCTSTEFVKVLCDQCKLNFCLKHRFPTSHQCKSLNQSKSPTLPSTSIFKSTNNNTKPTVKPSTSSTTTTKTTSTTTTNQNNKTKTESSHHIESKNQKDQLKDIRNRQNQIYLENILDIQILMTNGKLLKHKFKKSDQLKDVQTFIQQNRTDGDTSFALAHESNLYKPFTIKQLNNTLDSLGITLEFSNLIMIELIEDNPNENLRKPKSMLSMLNPFNYFGSN